MSFQLKRVARLRDGAFGVLLQNGVPFAVTLERTYDPDNSTKIGLGFHECHKTRYHKGNYDTYEITVPGHSLILFHRGNVGLHSDGCVLVAESYASFGDKPGIAMSAEGFNEFMKRAAGDATFDLEVTEQK